MSSVMTRLLRASCMARCDAAGTGELTDEDPSFPIEAALCPGPPDGWRASLPGPQVIRLVFDQPHALHHLCLMFVEE